MGTLLIYRDNAHVRVRSLKLRHGRVDAMDKGAMDLLHRFCETLQ